MTQPRRFLALTGLTPAEFEALLPAFENAHAALYPPTHTLDGQPRRREVPAGRPGALDSIEDKLLFILVYQKTYPLQVVLGELFGISAAQANYWLQRLLPVLRDALDDLGVMPERDGSCLAAMKVPVSQLRTLIIDGTERRRQRPKSPEKQVLFYSGKKKAHTDKNILVVNATSDRVLFLSATYPGKTHDKRVADQEHIVYPGEAVVYKDTGFQGYEPAVRRTYQPKKKAAGRRADGGREACQSPIGADPNPCGACAGRCEAEPHCERYLSQQERRVVGLGDGHLVWSPQPQITPPKTWAQTVKTLISEKV